MNEGLPLYAEDMDNGTRHFLRDLVGSAREEMLEPSDHLTGADQLHGTGAADRPVTLEDKKEQLTKEMRSLLDTITGKTGEQKDGQDQVKRRPTATDTAKEIQSKLQGEQIRVQMHFADAIQHDSEKKQKEMEQEVKREAEAAAAAAKSAVYDKYRQATPRSWNESDKDRAFRSLAQGIRASCPVRKGGGIDGR